MNLPQLARKENELCSIVRAVTGTADEKIKQLEEQRIFDEYASLFYEYSALHNKNLESIKRGIFLYWYSRVEDPCFTGIRKLDPEAETKLLNNLCQYLKSNKGDYELCWMLNQYLNWDDASLACFKQYSELMELFRKHCVTMPKHIDLDGMSERGQMGLFWSHQYFFA